jgi:peroxiredoxin
MVRVNSTMLPMGTKAPDFSLPDTSGRLVSLADFKDVPALLVIFMCNHCPYVKHVRAELAGLVATYQQKGVGVVAINSNDAGAYPDDSPEQMERIGRQLRYTFPFLVDGDQSVAQAFQAACTPDFFLYDRHRALVYRGQMDDSRPGNGIPVTGKSLSDALDAVLSGAHAPAPQRPSLGCNIKWKPGNEPDYFKEGNRR